MQLPKELEAEMKYFYRKNKKTSHMSTATQAKPKKKKLTENDIFIRDLVYERAYGKSYDEIFEIVSLEAQEKNAKILAEQAKVLAKQAKVLVIEQSIATMFQKTGWDAEKIADISGFPLDLVQKIVNTLEA